MKNNDENFFTTVIICATLIGAIGICAVAYVEKTKHEQKKVEAVK